MELKPALSYAEQIIKLRKDHKLSIPNNEFAKEVLKKSKLLQIIRLWNWLNGT